MGSGTRTQCEMTLILNKTFKVGQDKYLREPVL